MTAHLLHRNVCPGSVLVTRRGTWKLAGLEFAGTVVLGLVFLFLFSDSRFAIFFTWLTLFFISLLKFIHLLFAQTQY
jgi:hypothetical protein